MRTLTIGDPVTTPSGQAGILRWRGRINGKPIEYAGVEISNGEGLHSGEHEGHKYFDTKVPGSGIFVSYSKLLSANITTPLSRLGNSRLPALASPGKTSRAQSPMSPHRQDSGGDANEVTRLKALLEDRDAKIKDLKASKELQRTEFRKHIQSIEADRNQIAEHYENMLRDAANNPTASEQAEIDVQRTALAAMQNKLMEENEQMRQSLEAAQREAAEAKAKLGLPASALAAATPADTDLDSLLAELNAQEDRLAELQDSVQRADQLRQQNTELQTRNTELEQRCSEMEAHLDEVAALKDSLDELTLSGPTGSGDVTGGASSSSEALEEAQQEIERLKQEVETHKKRANKFAQEAEDARKDAQMYFKMSMETGGEGSNEKVDELQDQIDKLKRDLKRAEATAKNAKLELERAKESAGSTPKRKSIREQVKLSMANGQATKASEDSSQQEPKTDISNTAAKDVPSLAAPTLESTSERELEDQILREAGLLDPPSGVPSVPAPVPAPVHKTDPAAGRSMWCGLCERSGHTSVDCPYD